MSSSEEDIPVVVKAIKRRKRVLSKEHLNQKVNLYSHKVTPLLKKVDENILLQTNNNKEPLHVTPDEQIRPLPPTHCTLDTSKDTASDDDVLFIKEVSPIKDASVTPPPVKRSRQQHSRPSTIERKRNRLLKNVASVVSLAQSHDLINQSFEPNANESIEEPSRHLLVKIRFHSTIYRFPHEKNLTFDSIFTALARKQGVTSDLLFMTFNDHTIKPSDTPVSIGLSVADIIDCVLLDKDVLVKTLQSSKCKADNIKLHFQCTSVKTKRSFFVNKYHPLECTMLKYAQSIGCDLHVLLFQFDGERIELSSTASQLDLETDDCIDVLRRHT
uniref:NFATC2-interacting protein n=1 Tax=Phallusia mammillata TaxID=59560 RepID=A0A6F9DGN3_9ASCI|nr:uncharacterized protein LOC100180925 [Phallusia mammillata]